MSKLSPDGKWMWSGTEWIPAPPNEDPPSPSIIPSSSPSIIQDFENNNSDGDSQNKIIASLKLYSVTMAILIIAGSLLAGLYFLGVFSGNTTMSYSGRTELDANYGDWDSDNINCQSSGDEDGCNVVFSYGGGGAQGRTNRANFYLLSDNEFNAFRQCLDFDASEFMTPNYNYGGFSNAQGITLPYGNYYVVVDNGFRFNECGDERDTDGYEWNGSGRVWTTYDCYWYDYQEEELVDRC